MSFEHTLFIVDDDEVGRQISQDYLAKTYTVESFASADDCLSRLTEKTPDLFLIGIDMAGSDGLALSRAIRAADATRETPIILASASNDLDTHLAGYDAGGNDFVVKPVALPELRQKIEVLLRTLDDHKHLVQQLADSEMLTSLILANLDEYAVLLKFLRELNGCRSLDEVAQAILALLRGYHLDGCVQFRLPSFELTINQACEVKPLEASIIKQVQDMGGVVEYKNRAAFNFPRISVLVNDMPLGDPELCGRLRDHLAISVETADSKIHSIITQQENQATGEELLAVLGDLGNTVTAFREKYKGANQLGAEKTAQMLVDLESEFVSLGMREIQETSIKAAVQTHAEELIGYFDFSQETERTFGELTARLQRTLQRVQDA